MSWGLFGASGLVLFGFQTLWLLGFFSGLFFLWGVLFFFFIIFSYLIFFLGFLVDDSVCRKKHTCFFEFVSTIRSSSRRPVTSVATGAPVK